jgi:hypothetical protein
VALHLESACGTASKREGKNGLAEQRKGSMF